MERIKKSENILDVLSRFVIAAMENTEAIKRGDYKIANRNYDIIISSINYLKKNNQEKHLLNFLNHDSISVRMWAANYILGINEKLALETLESIKNGKVFISFEAKMIIEEWKKGNLKR